MRGRKRLNTDTLFMGGLHRGDFEWACRQYEDAGYVLVGFELDVDGYHWKAVYVRAEVLEKRYYGPPRPCLCLCANQVRCQDHELIHF